MSFPDVYSSFLQGLMLAAMANGRSPREVLRLYLRLRTQVFIPPKPYDGAKLEEILKKEFGAEKRMSSIKTHK